MNIYYIPIAIFFVTSCGGGGNGSGDVIPGGTVDDIGCTQEFYQTLIGSYRGTLELNESGSLPRSCQWDANIEISGTSVLARCLLRSSTRGPSTQLTFYPDDDLNRYQCLDDMGERTVSESVGPTFSPTELPGLDNSLFPIEIRFSKNNLIDRGPYLGDESLTARYVNIFDGSQSDLADSTTVEGDGTISIRTSSGELLGTLVKDQ